MKIVIIVVMFFLALFLTNSKAAVLYDNGPIVSSIGTGLGGLDESILQFQGLGMFSISYSNQAHLGNRIADDFTIGGTDWDIGTITFYAFQTGATASTITNLNLQIWDGSPDLPTSNVIFGDLLTNRMSSTFNTNILRVRDDTTGMNDERQVAGIVVDVNITLSAGTYWLDWSCGGSTASGPYAPPITITGQKITGNALQSNDDGVAWVDTLDFGTMTQQGFPFIIEDNSTDLIYSNGFEAP